MNAALVAIAHATLVEGATKSQAEAIELRGD
ncbi:MAG: hypothetical protein JWM52_351 [Candidatus Saccharibacteria bacterium]|nr:hypothetical protein [Candidatus Saccharibacteria bacterium]